MDMAQKECIRAIQTFWQMERSNNTSRVNKRGPFGRLDGEENREHQKDPSGEVVR